MSQNLSFPAGSVAPQCVDVVIVDDDIGEEDEEFMVIADGTTGDYINYNGVVTITIERTIVVPQPGRLFSFSSSFLCLNVQLES